MGLIERFKEKLESKDIFKNKKSQYMSSPQEGGTPSNCTSFDNIQTRILSKIKQTPYWMDFSVQRQKQMIRSYIEGKCSDISSTEKERLIEDILSRLSNSEN